MVSAPGWRGTAARQFLAALRIQHATMRKVSNMLLGGAGDVERFWIARTGAAALELFFLPDAWGEKVGGSKHWREHESIGKP